MSNHKRMFVSITKTGESLQQRDLLDSFGTDLAWKDRMPSARSVYKYCINNNASISKMLDEACGKLEIHEHANHGRINTIIAPEDKKYIRVMIYSGDTTDLKDLKLNDVTHTMIVRFDNTSNTQFIPTEPHENYPIFYQNCSSTTVAIRYIESLLIDSCMCHYMAVSDAAMHHDEKQSISSEKVQFIKELVNDTNFNCFDEDVKKLIKYVADKLKDNTPYISFFSIFTILTKDLGMGDDLKNNINKFFKSYYMLWVCFQQWYYKKHGLLFRTDDDVNNAIKTIFDRNKFQGQVSEDKVKLEIKNQMQLYVQNLDNPDVCVYVFVILKNLPKKSKCIEQCETVFGSDMHPASWIVMPLCDVSKYNYIKDYIEIIPFMISK